VRFWARIYLTLVLKRRSFCFFSTTAGRSRSQAGAAGTAGGVAAGSAATGMVAAGTHSGCSWSRSLEG